MKLTFFLITAIFFQVRATSTYAQKINLKAKNGKLAGVLEQIARQSGYDFIYGNTPVNTAKPVTLSLRNEDIESALKKVFAGQELTYTIRNKTVVLYKKEHSFLDKVADFFQTTTITGKVVDENNVALAGVTVQLKGASTMTKTNTYGNYSIVVPDKNSVLMFSYIGFASQEMNVGASSTINVQLKPSAQLLEETVIVAYGTQKKKDLTGSVSTISGESLSDLPSTINLEQALQGRAAGVHVVQETGQPGAATKVRIRGASSLMGSNQPLYVVDGVPVVAEGNIPNNGSPINNTLLDQGLSSPLNNIDPSDIESISILKDASATSIYGSRAANGVIIIATKKGLSNRPTYLFNSSISFQEAQTVKTLSTAQFKEIWMEAARNSTSTAAVVARMRDGSYFGSADTNWEKELSPSNPLSRITNFSAGGGNDKSRYYVSLGNTNQDGTFVNSGFERYNLLANLDFNASKALKFGTSLNLSSSSMKSPDGSLTSRIYTFRPDLPVFDENGDYTFSEGFSQENPVALSKATNMNRTNLLIGSAFGELTFANYFKLRSVLSINYNTGNLKSYYPSQTVIGGWVRATGQGTGYGQQSTSQALSHLWENVLNYNQNIGKHALEGIAGASWQGDSNEYLSASGMGYPQDDVLNNLGSATSNFLINSTKTQTGLISFFGRANYSFDSKYLLSVSARTDGSSKFAVENKWAFFPTAAAAWRLSEESFMKNVNFLDELKIRGSIGVIGQQNFGPYQWRTLFASTQYGGFPGVDQSQLGNSRLRWELTTQSDLGLDFSLFQGRVSGAFDYYVKNTKDLLYTVSLPGSTGFANAISNLGRSQNKGWELAIDGNVIQNKDFTWNLSVNMAKNNNKLVSLNSDFLNVTTGNITPPTGGYILRVGQSFGLMYGRVAEGIIQTQAELDELNSRAVDGVYQTTGTRPGDIRFKDLNGDGKVTSADQEIIGKALPDFAGGFTNIFKYKTLKLSALFVYSVGNDLRWSVQAGAINFANNVVSENKLTMVLDRWTPENPTNQPRAVYGDPNLNATVSSFYVYDASFLRLKNINLSYGFPTGLLNRSGFIKNLEINASATNLLTITKYPGANPETSNLFGDDLSAGLDSSRFPMAKVFTLGLRAGF